MVRIFQTIEIAAPADDVWRLVGRPDRIAEFHPRVTTAEVDGNVRTCTLIDGSTVRERIVDHSIVHRFYTYELAGGAPAFRAYRACLGVRGHGDHSHVDWDVELDPVVADDACQLARGIEAACLEGLSRLRDRLEASLAAA